MNYKFSPSLMCMNLLEINQQIEILNERADYYHVDIMDGHFVKNITLSPFFIGQIKPAAKIPIDAHLMVERPDDYIEEVAKAGADFITIHAETINGDAFRLINKIKSLGCRVGIALNPETPVESIIYYIKLIDKLTIMTVDPGFAGQPFVSEMLDKIAYAKELREKNGCEFEIEVDGACGEKTFGPLAEAGAQGFVLGSSSRIFEGDISMELAWDRMISNFMRLVA